MKTAKLSVLKAICFSSLISFSMQAAAQGPDHKGMQPNGEMGGMGGMGSKGGMMHKNMKGKMGMDHMTSMMSQCMKEHGNGKMCDEQAMIKCEEGMTAEDCSKMVTESKKKIEVDKNKK
ncbi:MAG: hypothetical protein H7249_13810 [Chitinophagaceae bacterium]|nr:hypothetical protein [Oligoflexus sp.]